MNKKIMNALFPKETKNVALGKCPFCSNDIDKSSFRNDLSKREFLISGLCQKCQDNFFGKGQD